MVFRLQRLNQLPPAFLFGLKLLKAAVEVKRIFCHSSAFDAVLFDRQFFFA
jgi:hypothetical protein